MSVDPYVLPGSHVLRNKLGLEDERELDTAERWLVGQRQREGAPSGEFDLSHLRAIHRHLFQDVYEWAGEIRKVEIAKGGNQFQFRQYIENGVADIRGRLMKSAFLAGLSREAFAKAAAEIIGDLNYVHPFREGNGRTQAEYLRQLCDRAGHPIDLTRFDQARWLDASRAAHRGDYGPMTAEIARATAPRLGLQLREAAEQALTRDDEFDRGR